jgi:hypothetical protein
MLWLGKQPLPGAGPSVAVRAKSRARVTSTEERVGEVRCRQAMSLVMATEGTFVLSARIKFAGQRIRPGALGRVRRAESSLGHQRRLFSAIAS